MSISPTTSCHVTISPSGQLAASAPALAQVTSSSTAWSASPGSSGTMVCVMLATHAGATSLHVPPSSEHTKLSLKIKKVLFYPRKG